MSWNTSRSLSWSGCRVGGDVRATANSSVRRPVMLGPKQLRRAVKNLVTVSGTSAVRRRSLSCRQGSAVERDRLKSAAGAAIREPLREVDRDDEKPVSYTHLRAHETGR